MATMFAHMMHQQQQTNMVMQQVAASQQSIATASAPKAPTISFPKWDTDTPDKLPVYLELLRAYKADPYFAPITNWATTEPHTTALSARIHNDMLKNLPHSYMSTYLNNPLYSSPQGGLGIEMLHHFMDFIQPSRPENRLNNLQAFCRIEHKAQESIPEFWSRLRKYLYAIGNLTFLEAAPLLGLSALNDTNTCEGLIQRYYSGDPSIISADLAKMEQLSMDEAQRRHLLGNSQDPFSLPAASRSSNNPSTPSQPPPAHDQQPTQQVAFPPTRGIQWKSIKAVH